MRTSRFRSALAVLSGMAGGQRDPPGAPPPIPTRVVSLVSGKGGVGKTTLANNLAVYARTVDTSLPVLVVGLGGRTAPDDMFARDAPTPQETLDGALRRGSFESAIRLGRYGVYYVPTGPRGAASARRVVEPDLLRHVLRRTAFPGLVVLDTGSHLDPLTRSAIAASDLCLVPVADAASLESARQVVDLLGQLGRPRRRIRVVLSMLDLRIKYPGNACADVLGLLVAESRRLDLPLCQGFVARSPRVQALATNPEHRTFPVLHEARRTVAHHQLGELAEEMLEVLAGLRSSAPAARLVEVPPASPEDEAGPELHLRPRTPAAAMAIQTNGAEPFVVRRFPFFIGRQDASVMNDLAIPDLRPWQVSRRHAHLVRRGDRIGVMDLGSALGTWVDGHQLGSPTLDPGPVYFARGGGELILGRRDSPYAFDVAVVRVAAERARQEVAIPMPRPLEPAALAS